MRHKSYISHKSHRSRSSKRSYGANRPKSANVTSDITAYIIKNRYLLMFYIGIIAGTFFANFFGRQNINNWGLYNNDYLEMMSAVSFDYAQLWGYVALERGKLLAIVILCGLTSISTVCMFGFMLFAGFELGIMVSMAVMQYGGIGVILVLISLFPQWIFYIAVIILLCRHLYEKRDNTADIKKEKASAMAVVLVLAFAGVCTEVLVNPMLIKNLIYVIY